MRTRGEEKGLGALNDEYVKMVIVLSFLLCVRAEEINSLHNDFCFWSET